MDRHKQIVETILKLSGIILIAYAVAIFIYMGVIELHHVFFSKKPETITALSHYTDWTYAGFTVPGAAKAIASALIGLIFVFLGKKLTLVVFKSNYDS